MEDEHPSAGAGACLCPSSEDGHREDRRTCPWVVVEACPSSEVCPWEDRDRPSEVEEGHPSAGPLEDRLSAPSEVGGRDWEAAAVAWFLARTKWEPRR